MHSSATDSSLEAENRALRETIAEQQRQLEQLRDALLNLQRSQFGQRSERGRVSDVVDDLFHPMDQPKIDSNDSAQDAPCAPAKRDSGTSSKKPARQPLPPDLPRYTERHDFDAAELEALNDPQQISVEVTETLEYEPGSLYVARHEFPKYAVTGDDGERTVVTPQRRTAPMPGAQVGATLLTHTAVSKVGDHLPLNRIAKQFERDGITIPRQRLCDYLLGTADILKPLAERMQGEALGSPILHSDDTTVPQREKGRRQTKTARLWAYLGRGRDDGVLIPFFEYTTTREQSSPLALLADYSGYLQADAYAAYRNADRLPSGPSWVACWAHARRGFEKVAHKQRSFGRAHVVMKLIRALYQLESRLERDGVTDPEAIAAARQARALPILERLNRFLHAMLDNLPPRGELARAVQYALNHWGALLRYTEDGRLEPDNNQAERLLRGVCVGRKNWNFTGSERGGHALATLLTLIEGCKLAGVNPRNYLIDVLRRIQDHPVNRLEELLPHNWAAAQTA